MSLIFLHLPKYLQLCFVIFSVMASFLRIYYTSDVGDRGTKHCLMLGIPPVHEKLCQLSYVFEVPLLPT